MGIRMEGCRILKQGTGSLYGSFIERTKLMYSIIMKRPIKKLHKLYTLP